MATFAWHRREIWAYVDWHQGTSARELKEGGEWGGVGGGFGTQRFLYQNGPKLIFHLVNFIFSQYKKIWIGGEGAPPPPIVASHSKGEKMPQKWVGYVPSTTLSVQCPGVSRRAPHESARARGWWSDGCTCFTSVACTHPGTPPTTTALPLGPWGRAVSCLWTWGIRYHGPRRTCVAHPQRNSY